MKRVVTVALVLLLGLGLAACVAGSAESARAASGGAISQLALGFWHGLIAPVMLIVEVVNKFWPHLLPWSVKFYEARGTGVIYDVGFYFGLMGSPVLVLYRRPRRV
ncbi:MAG TPA: hypothetical protein VMU37_02910 [Caulobacteraceae bacterium]|nr:hypothetical protein [Caulobacteraceae bacterium]